MTGKMLRIQQIPKTDPMSQPAEGRSRVVTIFLIVLPIWLVASGGFAVWYFLRQEKIEALAERERFVQAVSAPMIADDLKKFVKIIGERHASSPTGSANLTRAASMIEGLLGPSNTGFNVTLHRGPGTHPLIQVTLRGSEPDAKAVWVVSSYDSRPGSPGVEANATGLAATLAAAQALADHQPLAPVHFLFLPHANDPGSPVAETLSTFLKIAGDPAFVLYVESMGANEELWLSSQQPDLVASQLINGVGSIKDPDASTPGNNPDISTQLADAGLPVVRVATRPQIGPDEPDSTLPNPEIIAAATGRLVELIRRCAATRPPGG